MSITPPGSSPFVAAQSPMYSAEDEAYKKIYDCAKVFSQGDEDLLNYIDDILKNPKYRENPEAYYANWVEERGDSEICLYPEDRALTFFRMNLFPCMACGLG